MIDLYLLSFFDDFEFGEAIPDFLVPLLFSFLLIALNLLFPSVFLIGVPYDFTGDAIYGAFVAAPYEEIAFRVVILGVSAPVLGPGAILLNAFLFSVFHLTTYGIGLQAAFIGAFFVGLFAALWVYQKKTLWAVIGVIVMHAIFNVFLASTKLFFLPI